MRKVITILLVAIMATAFTAKKLKTIAKCHVNLYQAETAYNAAVALYGNNVVSASAPTQTQPICPDCPVVYCWSVTYEIGQVPGVQ